MIRPVTGAAAFVGISMTHSFCIGGFKSSIKMSTWIVSLMASSALYASDAKDEIWAKAGAYTVVIHIEDDSGIALLCKIDRHGRSKIIASDEDIVPKIEKLVPSKEAFQLADQLAKREISASGGAKKMQALTEAYVKKYGAGFYNYLTPLSVAAYRKNGVIISAASQTPSER